MGYTSISDISLSNALLKATQDNKYDYSQELIRISTGKKYLKRSDDPIATNEAATINIDMSKNERWISNVESAENWEIATSSALENISSSMQSANELIVQMNSGILDADDYKNIAYEVEQIIESLVSSGNSKYLGTEIFAGVSTGSDPFTATRDADGKITDVTFLDPASGITTTSRRSVAISETSTSEYGLTGDEIFKFQNLENTGTEAVPNWQYVDVDIFETLIEIRDTLELGELPPLELSERAQAGLDNVTSKLVANSTSQQKFKAVGSNLSNLAQVAFNRLSEVEDLDVALAATNLTSFEAALEASYQILAGMNGLSLMDYI